LKLCSLQRVRPRSRHFCTRTSAISPPKTITSSAFSTMPPSFPCHFHD
jgi:hypothetical protein